LDLEDQSVRRRRLVLVAASVIITILVTWALLSYILSPEYHAMYITIEERNSLSVSFIVGEEVKAILPNDIAELSGYPRVYLEAGFGHLNIAGKNYDYVFASLYVQVENMPVGPQGWPSPMHRYVLCFFTNNSELGKVLDSYGFPHTYVQATYSYVSEDSMNRTLLSMRYPNGSLLLELSAQTSKNVSKRNSYGPKVNWYHLSENNLTIIHHSRGWYRPYRTVEGSINVTFSENSEPWKYTGKTMHTAMRYVSSTPVIYWEGTIGWTHL
jgi:hypothetical protein